jgi:hypothetical protein
MGDRKEGDWIGTNYGTYVSELRNLIAQFVPRYGDHQTSVGSFWLSRYSFSSTPPFGICSHAVTATPN